VIDINRFPLPQITEMTRATRKIGLGVMGFADLLIKLGIPYDSDRALETAENVMKFISDEATRASADMAAERGVFPAFDGSIYDAPGRPRVRNATRTTIAPTGTLSIIAGCSSGVEPLFALSYTRTILEGTQLAEVNPLFEEMARQEGFYSKDLMREVARKGGVRDVDSVPEHVKNLFITSHDIRPEWHVRMQAAFQKYTDNAVSKTVNFPHSATVQDVRKVYMLAYELGCKGITIYRDRSRDSQVLSIDNKEAPAIEGRGSGRTPRERPIVTAGVTEKVRTGCGNLYVTVNFDDDGVLVEVFCALGKAGGCASAQLEAITRLTSLALRPGVEAGAIIEHLRGIRCPSPSWDRGHAILSCPDAIAGVLERNRKAPGLRTVPGSETADKSSAKSNGGGEIGNLAGQCPDCAGLLVFQEGCFICQSCGYTKC